MSAGGGRPLLSALVAASLAIGVAIGAPAARAAPRRYTLDPGASRLLIHVGKAGLFGFAGHEHQVVAGTFRGSATFDPDRLAQSSQVSQSSQSSQSSVDVTFDAGALRVSGQGEPADDVPQVQAAMLGADCLDVRRFTTVRFVATSVAPASGVGPSGGDFTLRGELTLHGVTRPLTLRVHLDVKGDTLEATGRTTLRQTDFSITPISKAGVVKVKDEIAIEWRVRDVAR